MKKRWSSTSFRRLIFAARGMEPRLNYCCRCYQLAACELQNWTISFCKLLYGILVVTSLVTTGLSKQPSVSGFISIDCGGKGPSTDRVTGLEWITDEGFLSSASDLRKKHLAIPTTVNLDDHDSKASIRENAEQLKTAMVFLSDPSTSKYCYDLNVSLSNINSSIYLVRAMFPTRNLINEVGESLSGYHSRFNFSVDSTVAATIELDDAKTQRVELVVNSLDEFICICLVPLEVTSSMAAISSLELRPLPDGIYGRVGGQSETTSTYFMTVARFNFGGNESEPALRYPDDIYDRLWFSPEKPENMSSKILTRRNSSHYYDYAQENWDQEWFDSDPIVEPSEVMRSAWEGVDVRTNISFSFNISAARSYRPLPTFYVSMYFWDVHPRNKSGQRFEDIFLDSEGSMWEPDVLVGTDFNETYKRANTSRTFYSYEDLAIFRLTPNGSSELPAMINLAELLGKFEAVTQKTPKNDTLAIIEFSSTFANNHYTAVDRSGDPCLPVPWSWLVCSMEIPTRITEINLANKGLEGKLPAMSTPLIGPSVLDLSNNSFFGNLPQTLEDTVTLRILNLGDNKLSGTIPIFKEKSFKSLEILSLHNNNLTGSLASVIKALDAPASSLNFSNNSFLGNIPPEIVELENLKTLDVSFNDLVGSLPNELFQLTGLETLNLQNNTLEGMAPDEIWRKISHVNINLNGNKFTSLNLTSWFQGVNSGLDLPQLQQRVTILHNRISTVILPTSHGDIVDLCSPSVRATNGFILLKGNPWCDKLAKSSMTLIERYLCRSSETEDFCTAETVDHGPSKKPLIIGVAVSGFAVVLMACIVAVFVWKTWRRMEDLRRIQEALAKDDVRPPFYKYEDLKAATRDFSEEKELGRGAFGIVYKAELAADNSVVAVKLLGSTEQHISEFLKEMVLITGIKHRNLIQLKGCCVRDKKRMLVYEYAENGNLAQALWGKNRSRVQLNWEQRLNICVGIAKGLSYLHEELHPKIIHRDIKPQNILLDKDWNAKIADFGLARPVIDDSTQRATSIGGTLGYFSPEYATQGLLTEKLDVYSYGILVLEIFAGRRCLETSRSQEEVYLRNWALKMYVEGRLWRIAEECLLEIVSQREIESVLKTALLCVQQDHEKRPCMSQVVNLLIGGKSDTAMDILSELKGQQHLYESLFDVPTSIAPEDRERDDRALLSWDPPSTSLRAR